MNKPYQPNLSQNSSFSQKKGFASFKPRGNNPRRLVKRYMPRIGRNRLQRVQNIINRTTNTSTNFQRPYQRLNNNPNKFNNNRPRINNNREIYVKGLPRFVDNSSLFALFKTEGRIIKCNILYDNVGFSRGIGRILFTNFKDAMNVIKKWNNTIYKGNTLKVEYKTVPNVNGIYVNKGNRINNNYFKRFNNFKQGDKYQNKFRQNHYNNNGYKYDNFRNNSSFNY